MPHLNQLTTLALLLLQLTSPALSASISTCDNADATTLLAPNTTTTCDLNFLPANLTVVPVPLSHLVDDTYLYSLPCAQACSAFGPSCTAFALQSGDGGFCDLYAGAVGALFGAAGGDDVDSEVYAYDMGCFVCVPGVDDGLDDAPVSITGSFTLSVPSSTDLSVISTTPTTSTSTSETTSSNTYQQPSASTTISTSPGPSLISDSPAIYYEQPIVQVADPDPTSSSPPTDDCDEPSMSKSVSNTTVGVGNGNTVNTNTHVQFTGAAGKGKGDGFMVVMGVALGMGMGLGMGIGW